MTSPNKLAHLEKLSDANGIIAAAAMDQRGSLKKSIAKERGVDPSEITNDMMAEFKSIVTKVLTPHASAILLDPEFGLPAAKVRSSNAGLLLAYEKTGYDQAAPGRMPSLLSDWTVGKIAAEDANAVKILMYYSPFEAADVNAAKQAWIERIGVECAYHDIPFFLEFVGYPTESGQDQKGLAYAQLKPEIVKQSMQEFSKPHYHVDVLKVEVPINMQFVEGAVANKTGEVAYTQQQAKELFLATAEVTDLPFIYLSAGVSDAEFRESLSLANDCGVEYNGVLCGRATWKEGMPVYAKSGPQALEDWLNEHGVRNITELNKVLEAGAKPWTNKIKKKVAA